MSEAVFAKPPAHGRISNWLGPQMRTRLLDYAQAHCDSFSVTGVGRGEHKRVDLTLRRSMRLKQLGDLEGELQARARETLPAMFERLGAARFEPSKLELEMVAHGDGAFYAKHRDTNVFSNAGAAFGNRRIISAVYYFHSIPKSFSGGVLRIYSFTDNNDTGSFVDIEPTNDSLVFFPSWFPHEVLPVTCPSGRFEDSRFAINCWVRR
jgi:Rps23 Pro-64 3,4-dihydroxylase Tpa1-like proline 4-hydroxylase